MAGIGPVVGRVAGLKAAGINTPKNELEIFCFLCVGRVYYHGGSETLYFVDSPTLSVSQLIRQVFRGLRQSPSIRQLYMDEHNLFSAASRIRLKEEQKNALFIALRLSGVQIVYSENTVDAFSELPEIPKQYG